MIKSYAGYFLLFFLFWAAVSSSLHWQQLLIGAAASVFVIYFNRTLLITAAERPGINLTNLFHVFLYAFRLLGEIIKANFQVVGLVLHPRMPISPGLVSLPVDLKQPVSRVLLANSITLTPGTLTVLAAEEHLLIHTLTADAAAGLENWNIIKALRRLEGGGK